MEQVGPTPIFIFSLPRSGSTLLQKIIASSTEVGTSSEPWLLLPLVYSQRDKGTVTEYSHEHSLLAFQDVRSRLHSNNVSHDQLLREFVLKIYGGLTSDKKKYFLDKTPRYYLIISEIVRIFPNAKFIFLFRNPLAQFSSHLKIHRERFRTMYFNAIDIVFGHNLLAEGYDLVKKDCLKISYWELVSEEENTINKLNAFLGTKIDNDIVNGLKSVELKGNLGDPGLMANARAGVNTASLEKWKTSIDSTLRKRLASAHLNSIGNRYFELLGTTKSQLLEQINDIEIKYLFKIRDVADIIYCFLNMKLKLALLFSKKYFWSKFKRLS
ncbi:sulfotransferase [Akkermansiaceae bacterium]|nr:sulfotransferase [Akkermansiaceae bacterium]